MKNLLILIGAFAIFPIIIIYSSFSWGYVATVFQNWFICPIYPTFEKLSWRQYAGIMFFVGCFIRPSSLDVKKEFKETNSMYAMFFLGPWIALFCAWVFTLFI